MNLIFDPKGDGLSKVLRDYQIEAMKFVWENNTGVNSRDVWHNVNKTFKGEKTISRASIINFLNNMVEEGALDYKEKSGKGGYHRVYFPKLDESGFKKAMAKSVISSLMRDFPDETNEVLRQLKSK
jgi:predicted transcriptional regulator